MRKALLIATLCFASFIACSQNDGFIHLTVDDGLPSNRVYSVFEDSKGFIWFATDMGVARYNGISIERYTTKDGLPDNEVFSFFEDMWGRIWASTLSCTLGYFEDEKWHVESAFQLKESEKNIGTSWYFYQSADDSSFYYFKKSEKFVYNINRTKTSKFSPFKNNFPGIEKYKKKITEGTATLYCAFLKSHKNLNNNAVFQFSEFQERLDKKFSPPKTSLLFISERGIKTMTTFLSGQPRIIVSEGTPYISNDGKLFNLDTREYTNNPIPKNEIYSYLKIGNEELIGTSKGLEIWQDNIYKKTILSDNLITKTLKDKHQTLYISTYSNGVYIQPNSTGQISSVKHQMARIELDEHSIFSTPQNEIVVKSKNNSFKLLDLSKSFIFWDKQQDKIRKMYTHKNSLFICTNYRIYIVDNLDAHIAAKKLIKINRGEYFGLIKETLKIGHHIYARSSRQISRYDLNSRKAKIFKDELDVRFDDMTYSRTSGFWVCNKTGIYNLQNEKLSRSKVQNDRTFLQLGTWEDKLIAIDLNNKICLLDVSNKNNILVEEIETKASFKTLKQIRPTILIAANASSKNIMLINDKGTMRRAPAPSFIEGIGPRDIQIVNENILFQSRENSYLVPINKLEANPWSPSIFFKEIIYADSIYKTKNNHIIPYAARDKIVINFIASSKVKEPLIYSYKILNNEEEDAVEWTNSSQPQINLLNTGYGKYKILYKAINNYNYSSETKVIEFEVERPFWVKWWFILLSLIALITITAWITKNRQQRIQKRQKDQFELEKRYIKSEFKALNALMNPHFIFNSLNNIQGLVNEDEKENANKYLKIFSELVRQNMQNIKEGEISLEKEMNLVRNYLYLEKLRFKDRLTYEIEIDENVEINDIIIPPLTIQPIVENSVKHGIFPLDRDDGHIMIHIQEDAEILTIDVLDNGIGYSNSIKGKGNTMALNNINERFGQLSKLMGRDITFTIEDQKVNNKTVGTKATITLHEKIEE